MFYQVAGSTTASPDQDFTSGADRPRDSAAKGKIPVLPKVPDVVMDPKGFAYFPDQDFGPLAMVTSVRVDTGERVTTFTTAAALARHEVTMPDGSTAVDLSAVPEDAFCTAVSPGWPSDWDEGHPGAWLTFGLAGGLLAGESWEFVKSVAERRVMERTARRTARLN